MEAIQNYVDLAKDKINYIFTFLVPYREILSTTFKLSAILAVPNIIIWLICNIILIKYGRELEEEKVKKIKSIRRLTFFVMFLWGILGIVTGLTPIYFITE